MILYWRKYIGGFVFSVSWWLVTNIYFKEARHVKGGFRYLSRVSRVFLTNFGFYLPSSHISLPIHPSCLCPYSGLLDPIFSFSLCCFILVINYFPLIIRSLSRNYRGFAYYLVEALKFYIFISFISNKMCLSILCRF